MKSTTCMRQHENSKNFDRKLGAGSFKPNEDNIKALTMHDSKGLEFPVVALIGVGEITMKGEDERDEARQFYVEATRATQKLIVTLREKSEGYAKKRTN